MLGNRSPLVELRRTDASMYTTVVSALLLDATFLNVLDGEPWRRVLPTSRQQTVTRAYLRVILCGWGDFHPPGSLTVRAVH